MMVQMMMKLTLSKFPLSLRTGSLSKFFFSHLSLTCFRGKTEKEDKELRLPTFASFIHTSLWSTPHHHATYATCLCVCACCLCVVHAFLKLLTVTLTLNVHQEAIDISSYIVSVVEM